MMSVCAGSRTYLDNDLFSTSLLHHLGFIEPGIRMNLILERNYLESYCDAGTVRVKETNFGGNKILGNMPKLVPFKINFFCEPPK